ncbi:PDZ domain-containing protein [Paenibacillus sp. ACRRX]|uniref:PDZ domain-containing protein n=1 Tax=Paenibacillus sp. ACRRX TaxID=2918206 RepID=UPI001EF62F3E|nr:PDZ domain-containing protein [Paenibacillus sp. ACRRX]
MDIALEFGYRVAWALLQLLLSPFYWLSVVFIAIHYRRQMLLERRLFSVKMHSWIEQTWRAWLGGMLAGLCVSAASIGLGITIPQSIVFLLWGISIVLLLFRVRMLCLAYAAGVAALGQTVLRFMPDWNPEGWMGTLTADLRGMNAAGLLVLVALLHAAEAWLVRKQAPTFASPLFMESKRGRIVGAYQMQTLWPIPLFLLFPAVTAGEQLPWTPLLSGDIWQQGWMLMAFPVMIGFSELTYTYLPQEKAAVTSSRLFMYAVALLAVSLLANWWTPLIAVAGLIAIGMHEWLIWQSKFEESGRSPILTHDRNGLRVQAVLPGSPAEELGIRVGELISKVNGIPVRTKEELHQALRSSAAFCKLEVYNNSGDLKFVQRAVYAGEHHQLGVLLAPDDDVNYVAVTKPASLLHLLSAPWKRSGYAGITKDKESSA